MGQFCRQGFQKPLGITSRKRSQRDFSDFIILDADDPNVLLALDCGGLNM
jgi:hypothetical protein